MNGKTKGVEKVSVTVELSYATLLFTSFTILDWIFT